MIVGIGVDVVEVARIGEALERHGERFEGRILTQAERETCEGRADRLQAVAARFAAKEACLKALGTGWAEGIGFLDVEVVRKRSGRPEIVLHRGAAARAEALGVRSIHVSLTHERLHAAAVVVLEG